MTGSHWHFFTVFVYLIITQSVTAPTLKMGSVCLFVCLFVCFCLFFVVVVVFFGLADFALWTLIDSRPYGMFFVVPRTIYFVLLLYTVFLVLLMFLSVERPIQILFRNEFIWYQ